MASALLSSVTGGGGLPKLAPDLTYPSSLANAFGFVRVTGIDPSGSLTPILSLTGKYAIDLIALDNMTIENISVKLTIDGVVIWNDSFALGATNIQLFGSKTKTNTTVSSTMQCESSLLLELETIAQTSATLEYVARPIV